MNKQKINLKLTKNIDKILNEKIKILYLKAFPLAERMPYEYLEKAKEQGSADILAILDAGNFIGLSINLIKDNNVLLDYFAIDEKYRDMGYGSKALNLLRKFYEHKNIILEIELATPNKEIIEFENLTELDLQNRLRRKNFYLSNGLLETDIFVSLNSVTMQLLGFNADFDFHDYINLYIHSFGERVRNKIFKLEYFHQAGE